MIRHMVPPVRLFYSTVTASANSTLANKLQAKFNEFRTTEQTVANHHYTTIGRFYTIPTEVRKRIFSHGGLPKSFEKQIKTFNECSLMVRLPAVEIIEYIKRTDFNRPVNRFVLYGEDGVGKSLTMAHLLHYGFQKQYVLVHVPWVPNWMKRAKETANSTTKEGAIDLPLDGAAWLLHFKNQNGPLLKDLGLTVSRDYVWTKREITPAGAPLMDLVEHGINRAKFSCDTISALLHELKQHSTAGRARVMVLIDGFNAFFQPHTRLLTEAKARVKPEQLTLTDPFLSITRNDWNNGVCVVTIDQMVAEYKGKSKTSPNENTSSQVPLLVIKSRECFEHLDPFVPVRVAGYDDTEFYSCIQYYLERRWIQTTESGFKDELKMLSCQNPFQLMQLCASL